MLSTISRPWEDNRTKGDTENQGKVSIKQAVSKEVQQFVLNCYEYFLKLIPVKNGAITETTKTLKLPRKAAERINEKCTV